MARPGATTIALDMADSTTDSDRLFFFPQFIILPPAVSDLSAEKTNRNKNLRITPARRARSLVFRRPARTFHGIQDPVTEDLTEN